MKFNFKDYIVNVTDCEGKSKEEIKEEAIKVLDELKRTNLNDVPAEGVAYKTDIKYSSPVKNATTRATTLSNFETAAEKPESKDFAEKLQDFITSAKEDINHAKEMRGDHSDAELKQLVEEYTKAKLLAKQHGFLEEANTLDKLIESMEIVWKLDTFERPDFKNVPKTRYSEKLEFGEKAKPKSINSRIRTAKSEERKDKKRAEEGERGNIGIAYNKNTAEKVLFTEGKNGMIIIYDPTTGKTKRELPVEKFEKMFNKFLTDSCTKDEGRISNKMKEKVRKIFELEKDPSDKSAKISEDGYSFEIVRENGKVLKYNYQEGYVNDSCTTDECTKDTNIDDVYLEDEDFTKVTRQGYQVLNLIKTKFYGLIVVFKRPRDYGFGTNYDLSDGTWGQGHYDYRSYKDVMTDINADFMIRDSKKTKDSVISSKYDPRYQVSPSQWKSAVTEAKFGVHLGRFEDEINGILIDAQADAKRIANGQDTYFETYPTQVLQDIVNHYSQALKDLESLNKNGRYDTQIQELTSYIDTIKKGWRLE